MSGYSTAGGNLAPGTAVLILNNGTPQIWTLVSGTATVGPGIQPPDDYDPETNPIYWKQLF